MSPGSRLALLLVLAVPTSTLHAQRVGEFSLRGGVSIATPPDSVNGGTGPAVEASYGTRFGPVVILLEGGYLGVSSLRHVWRYGVGARYELGHATWRPYVVGGLGGYDDSGRRSENVDGVAFTSSFSWFGVNIGGGVRRGFERSPFSLLAEGRMHIRMQEAYPDVGAVALELVTLLVGGTLSW